MTVFFLYVILFSGMLENTFEIAMLYDFYGPLLSEKQQTFVELYHLENCSLTEIADMQGVSKQAVSEGIKRAEKALINYESKLKLVDRWKNEHGI